jgi:hypothetical protein
MKFVRIKLSKKPTASAEICEFFGARRGPQNLRISTKNERFYIFDKNDHFLYKPWFWPNPPRMGDWAKPEKTAILDKMAVFDFFFQI